MKETELDLERPETILESLGEARYTLDSGGVIVFPTDTIYGLGANALDEKAISKVYDIKNRNTGKPLSILVRDIPMAKKVACIDSKAEKILEKLWPGPVTVILRKKDTIPYILTADTENIAIRISDSYFVQELLESVNFPVTATSANIAGEKDLLLASEIRNKFSDAKISPDLFINSGDLASGTPSTIIDLTDINRPRLVRMGVVGKEKLDSFFKYFIS